MPTRNLKYETARTILPDLHDFRDEISPGIRTSQNFIHHGRASCYVRIKTQGEVNEDAGSRISFAMMDAAIRLPRVVAMGERSVGNENFIELSCVDYNSVLNRDVRRELTALASVVKQIVNPNKANVPIAPRATED